MNDQTEHERGRMTRQDWGLAISLFFSASSFVFSAGVIWTKLQTHETDIAILKLSATTNVDRLARIETKLDVILADKAAGEK